MLYNGIIEKKILQRLLQENHDLEYTIDELDTVIKTLDMYSIDNYYCVLDETDEVIDKFLLPSKKNFKKYKRRFFRRINRRNGETNRPKTIILLEK